MRENIGLCQSYCYWFIEYDLPISDAVWVVEDFRRNSPSSKSFDGFSYLGYSSTLIAGAGLAVT